MATIEQTVEVRAPIRTVYDQWTQFEEFPRFMGGVDEVTQLDDRLTHWRTSVGGVTREFDAEIVDQHPDQRVAWRSVDGTTHAGAVTFEKLDEGRTRVAARIDWEPESAVEKVGAAVGLDDRQVRVDLERFRKFVEDRGVETGAWRGTVD
ncbi:SRPBCC family protein [Cellulomonas sp. URHB0016]